MYCVATSDDIRGMLDYEDGIADTRVVRNGRRKLAIMEFWFLTSALKTYDSHAVVVYAGAAPGRHIDFVSSYFPNVVFLLFDTAQFEVTYKTKPKRHIHTCGQLDSNQSLNTIITEARSNGHRILIYQQLFTDDIAIILKGADYFWSDVRNKRYGSKRPSDADIVIDATDQAMWTSIIRPTMFMLKFRIPFYSSDDVRDIAMIKADETIMSRISRARTIGIDIMEDYESRRLRYLSGALMIQPYTRIASAETRLVGSALTICVYDVLEYERKMCYYSRDIRTSIGDNPMFDKAYGFDGCNDCRLEARAVKMYENKYGQYIVPSWYDKCHAYTNNISMKVNGHGERYFERPLNSLEHL